MNEFNFANAVLLKKSITVPSTRTGLFAKRELVFENILSFFNKRPIDIFQIGAIETFNWRWYCGSGWSDLFWGAYIKKYGGSITIIDINLDHIANSKFAASCMDYEITCVLGDAENEIAKKNYDLYYLDGSNSSEETANQFKKITATTCTVLVDDYDIKGNGLHDYGFIRDGSFSGGMGILRKENG